MSTTFGILIKDDKLIDLPPVEDYLDLSNYFTDDEIEEIETVEIAFRNNSGEIYWKNNLAKFLPVETKVYPLDNSPQGIYTIGNIIEETNHERSNI
jgi:hypothetical protein